MEQQFDISELEEVTHDKAEWTSCHIAGEMSAETGDFAQGSGRIIFDSTE